MSAALSSPGPGDDHRVTARQRRRVYLWLGAVALLLRCLYLSEHSASAFFGIPILDERYYDELARRLLEGRGAAILNPGFRPWLYPGLLAAIYALAGEHGMVAAQVLQHLMGVGVTLLVCSLAMEIYRRAAAGWLAGGLYVLAGPPLFYEGELLITTCFTLLALITLRCLVAAVTAGAAKARWWWLAVGLCLGLTVQARPNILLLALAVPFLALAGAGQAPGRWRRAAHWTALAAVGCVAVLACFGWLQRPLIGTFQWLPQSGGINLYLGNEQGADGMQPRQDEWVSYGEAYRDSVQVFAETIYRRAVGRPEEPVTAAAVSRYWMGRTWQEIRADPAAWGELMALKVIYLFTDFEIPNNKSYDFMRRHESTLLRWLPIRWGLLLGLAAVGWGGTFGRLPPAQRLRLLPLYSYIWLLAVGICLFFVNGRYRIPLWPAVAVLAGGGGLYLWSVLSARRWRWLGMASLLLLATLLVSGGLGAKVRQTSFQDLQYRDFFYRSLAYYEKGQLEPALEDARRSIAALQAAGSEDAAVWFQLGNVAMALGDDALAFDSYRRASELTPDEPRIYNNMGILHERQGRYADAYRGYNYALVLADEGYPPALVNMALLELRAGLVSSAAIRLKGAASLAEPTVPALCAMAFVARAQGDAEQARRLIEEARRRDSEVALRVLMELEQPLDLKSLGIDP